MKPPSDTTSTRLGVNLRDARRVQHRERHALLPE